MIDLSEHVYKRLNKVIRETISSAVVDSELEYLTPEQVAAIISAGIDQWIAARPVEAGIARVFDSERKEWQAEVATMIDEEQQS